MAYRSTPPCVTGRSPAELLFNRQIRTKLPELSANNQLQPTGQDAAVRRTDAVRKEKGRVDADRIRTAKDSTVKQGDKVLLRQQKQNKLFTPFEQDPYTVVDRKGCSVILEKDGKQIMRHVSFVKRWVQPEPDTVVPIRVAGERLVSHSTAPVETHEQDTRPQRTRRMPTHFVDYRLDRQCHKGAE